MDKEKKIYLIIIFGFLILTASYFLIYLQYQSDDGEEFNSDPENKSATGEITVKLIIDYGNGTKNIRDINLDALERTKSCTAFEILNSTHDLKSTYWASVDGMFIDCINDVCVNQSSGNYWFFFINGKLAQVGTDYYYLKDNDTIVMNYTGNIWF